MQADETVCTKDLRQEGILYFHGMEEAGVAWAAWKGSWGSRPHRARRKDFMGYCFHLLELQEVIGGKEPAEEDWLALDRR